MGLIGRDYDLVGQILKILKIKVKRKKGRCSLKGIADGQKYSESTKKEWG